MDHATQSSPMIVTMPSRKWVIWCLLGFSSWATLGAVGQSNNFTSHSVICDVLVAHIQYDELNEDNTSVDVEYICSPVDTSDGIVYRIPTSLMEVSRAIYKKGGAVVEIHGGRAVRGNGFETDDEILLEKGAYVVVLEERSSRLLAQSSPASIPTGTHSALVVRVTAVGNSIPLDANTISSQVFGSGFSLKTVYDDCSWGQLKFKPFVGRNVNNGVLELSINVRTNTTNRLFLENAMSTAVHQHFGSLSLWDHILYCVPQPTGKWIAYAYIGIGK